MQIWRMRADGSEQQPVFSDEYNNWFPHISPDGKWMVFLTYDKSVTGHPENKDVMLRLMSLSDNRITVFAKLFGGQGTINVPSWSPDGRKREAGQYRNGREEGPWVRWHTTGALAEAGVYRDGRREGRWTFWFANGEKAREAEYQADASVGSRRRWNLRGDPCPAPVDS